MGKLIEEHERALTTTALIALLQTMPQNLPVRIEGCDCAEWAVSVELFVGRGGMFLPDCVYIRRLDRARGATADD